MPVEKALKTVRSAFDARFYKDVPLARVLRIANREAWSEMFHDAATQSFIVKDE